MPNPTTGEISSALNTFSTCSQSTPAVPDFPCIIWNATPTPRIDPIIVCELDAGSPRYHVARFHRIAATSSAKIIANPEPRSAFRINSTGSSEMIANATVPELSNTPTKFRIPE